MHATKNTFYNFFFGSESNINLFSLSKELMPFAESAFTHTEREEKRETDRDRETETNNKHTRTHHTHTHTHTHDAK